MSCPCLGFEEGTGSFIWLGVVILGVDGVWLGYCRADGRVGAEVKSGMLVPGKAMLTAPKSALKLPQENHELM